MKVPVHLMSTMSSRQAHWSAGPSGPGRVPPGGEGPLREGRRVLRGEHGPHGRNTGRCIVYVHRLNNLPCPIGS